MARKAKKAKVKKDKTWKAFSKLSTAAAVAVTTKGMDTLWRGATGRKPPKDPANPDLRTSEAVTWAALSAAVVAAGTTLANRKAAAYYVKSTGKNPLAKAPKTEA